jgi:hypothetical protein
MRKFVFIFISVIFISANIFAQDDRSAISIGIKAGSNYSNVYDSNNDDFNSDGKMGLAAGVFVAIPIGKFIGFQPELLFSQKGYKSSGSILGLDYSLTRTSNYIDIPLLFALKPISTLTLLLGPQYSYLIKQTDVFDNPISSIVVEEEFNNDNIRKNTLGFIGGIDININAFVLGGRVSWDLLNNNGDGTSTSPDYKNVFGQITIGYRFN